MAGAAALPAPKACADAQGIDVDAVGRHGPIRTHVSGVHGGACAAAGLILLSAALAAMREPPCAPDGKKRERRSLMEQAKDWRKTKQYRGLKKSMLDNLEARGLLEKAYTDKVDEYLDFWVRRQELQTDVAERGLSVMDDRGRITENRSVSLEIQVARQMLAVWTALGFKDAAAKSDVPGGIDDEL